jgi:hypothetical protein
MKRIFSHSQANLKANLKNSLSLARKAFYRKNRADDGHNKGSRSDSAVRKSSCAKSNFFAEMTSETEMSIPTPPPTPTK